MARERVYVRFDSPEALRREFESNISNGGVFVATPDRFEIRQPVLVEIELSYAPGESRALTLEGEVVHRISPEITSNGGVPGIAIQFEDTAQALREQFVPLLGDAAVETSADADTEGPRRRSSRRHSVRVPVRIMPSTSPPFEATSRDLSSTGILLSMREIVLPVGEIVRICLWHPQGEPSIEIDGKVVRQVKNKRGRIAAVAVAFDRNQAADPHSIEVIDALRKAGHRSRLGGISGSIADLGLANMLQMFGSSAPRGTLVVEHDGEQGWIAFADGALLAAELGSRSGHDALVTMLDWGDGRFEFEASADESLVANAARRPLEGAILEAVCAIDERASAASEPEEDDDWAGQTMVLSPEDRPRPRGAVGPDTTFTVVAEREVVVADALDKVEAAALDLLRSGVPLRKLSEIIPEGEERIQSAVEGLVEAGVLRPR